MSLGIVYSRSWDDEYPTLIEFPQSRDILLLLIHLEWLIWNCEWKLINLPHISNVEWSANNETRDMPWTVFAPSLCKGWAANMLCSWLLKLYVMSDSSELNIYMMRENLDAVGIIIMSLLAVDSSSIQCQIYHQYWLWIAAPLRTGSSVSLHGAVWENCYAEGDLSGKTDGEEKTENRKHETGNRRRRENRKQME